MGEDSGFETFEDMGYDRTDWIPVFQPFEDHPQLAERGIPEKLRQETFEERGHEQSYAHGGEAVYSMYEGSGEIALQFSPLSRERDSLMARGNVMFSGTIRGEPLDNKYSELLEQVSAPYLEPAIGEISLASITIPENYSQEKLQDTVDTAVDILARAQGLQTELEETLSAYDI